MSSLLAAMETIPSIDRKFVARWLCYFWQGFYILKKYLLEQNAFKNINFVFIIYFKNPIIFLALFCFDGLSTDYSKNLNWIKTHKIDDSWSWFLGFMAFRFIAGKVWEEICNLMKIILIKRLIDKDISGSPSFVRISS